MEALKQVYICSKTLLRICIVILNNIYCVPTYFAWITLLQPLKWTHPTLYWKLEGQLYRALLGIIASWSWSAGYRIAEAGDDISGCLNSRTLVLVNHQCTGDVPLLIAALYRKFDVLPNIMWIMDKMFKYTNFGAVSMLHEDFFIQSGREQRDRAIAELRQHIHSSYIPRKRKWLMLFPEGGFLVKRRHASQRYAERHCLPYLQYVTLPRLGALSATIEELHFDEQIFKSDKEPSEISEDTLCWVLDITIGYTSKPLDLITIITGLQEPCTTTLFYRLYPISIVPSQKEHLTRWIYKIWEEKEHMLDMFYDTGKFLSSNYCSARLLHQSSVQYILLHLMFIVSTLLHYYLFRIACFLYYY